MHKVFKALSDPNRVKVLECIGGKSCNCLDCKCENCGMSPNEFQEILGVSFPTISHHIDKLRQSGLITTEKRGQKICCKLNKSKIEETILNLNHLIQK